MNSIYRPFGVLAVGLVLTFGCREEAGQLDVEEAAVQEVESVTIVIDEDHRILLDGELVALDDLEARLSERAATSTLQITIHPAPNAPMGLVHDVQQRFPIGSDVTYQPQ